MNKKKPLIKSLVMAGLVAGAVVASQATLNATQGESVMAAGGACGSGTGCGGQKRNLTADNAPAQQRPGERAATPEEIEQYKKDNPNHVEVQKGCQGKDGCHGKTVQHTQPQSASCSGKTQAPR